MTAGSGPRRATAAPPARQRRRRGRVGPSVCARLVVAASAFGAAVPGVAVAARYEPYTLLFSRAAAGGFPDGPSCCGAVSRDERTAQVMAYESLADDIAPGARRGVANVYAVGRRPPWTADGSPWYPGGTLLVSRGLRGRPANGASFAPKVSGDSAHPPRCVAFLSRASNLVPGDRNGVVDAFVDDLATGRLSRVSVNSEFFELMVGW